MIAGGARKSMLELRHPGFEDQEFDAQLEFFRHYGLPALEVPLLTDEFSRPLFLKLMCEGVKGLKRRSQRQKLREIASGQKSMTYVLEQFVKRAGQEVETKHHLAAKTCWSVMKGDPRNGRAGFAGVLAFNRREWLFRSEAVAEVQTLTNVPEQTAGSVVTDMVTSGLLVEQPRYLDGDYVDVLLLPYQRFSDHIVARHLLDEHLDLTSEWRLRRCLYADRRLGAVFLPDEWGSEFAEPGMASALMIEFPERVKRLADRGVVGSSELIAYLPKQRRLLFPFADAFLHGLYWRSASSFGADSERLVRILLEGSEPALQERTYEVLVGLGARAEHPLGATWLCNHLGSMDMAERDVEWSEFLRSAHSQSNAHRLLAWAETQDHAKVRPADAEQAMRLLALLLTTTDHLLRDRATRALVLIGEAHPQELFAIAVEMIGFGDPYVPDRLLGAAYGVCMRRWAVESPQSKFADSIAGLAERLLELLLRPSAPHSTWHTLIRGYAIGVVRVLLQLRPRAITGVDKDLLTPNPDHARSPFRDPRRIRKSDTADPEHAIHMDFGNYTIGRLVTDRGNYDFKHREYNGVRRQIADRIGRLGYSTDHFGKLDQSIGRYGQYRSSDQKVDRYGKKYSWIAYHEMYGLREAAGKLEDDLWRNPRTADCGVDPSFPEPIPVWDPPRRSIFQSSPVEPHEWIAHGDVPDYVGLLRAHNVDGHPSDWILLDADIHEGVPDGRELRGWVTSVFASAGSVSRIRAELNAGRDIADRGLPEPGSDHYTYHGEIPWSPNYGSDVRTPSGRPRHTGARAFGYFDGRWKSGIPVESTCRRWAWESHQSPIDQGGPRVFPSPALATALKLRVIGGSSDMVDQHGKVASLLREATGPGFGSRFLYVRRDLVESYMNDRRVELVQTVVGERDLRYDYFEQGLPDSLQVLYEARANRCPSVTFTSW